MFNSYNHIKLTVLISVFCLSVSLILSEAFAAGSEPEEKIYDIGVCISEDSEYENYISKAFADALSDKLGNWRFKLTKQTASPSFSAGDICADFATIGVDLILAVGDDALSAAAESTPGIPIVCADVADIPEAIHLIPQDSDDEPLRTELNVTGVSGAPFSEEELSLIIETNQSLKSVGILFFPGDSSAVYQNDQLEGLLDEARIPWKEYELGKVKKAASSEDEDSGGLVIPEYTVAANSKEGPNIDVDNLGEDGDLTGINSPNSARSAQVSQYWTEDMNKSRDTPSSDRDRIKLACRECSFLCVLSPDTPPEAMDLIREMALSAKVPTFGGNEILGEDTLVSLYRDPYDDGYQAGLMAAEILQDEKDPGSMEIEQPGKNAIQKLYNPGLAKSYGIAFPKSFEPLDGFLKEYRPGDRTERQRE